MVAHMANRDQGQEYSRRPSVAEHGPVGRSIHHPLQSGCETMLAVLEGVVTVDPQFADEHRPRSLATKLLEMDPDAVHRLEQSPRREAVMAQVEEGRRQLEKTWGEDAAVLVAERRYGFLGGTVREGPEGRTGQARRSVRARG